jgi:hypothetical protein
VKSTEKVDELRRAVAAAVAADKTDPTLQIALGVWAFIPGFMRRRLLDGLPLHVLADAAALDELLGLIAGAALELRTDMEWGDAEYREELAGIYFLREQARGLFAQLRALG